MSLVIGALTVGLSAFTGLAYARWKSSGREASPTLRAGAAIASFGAGATVFGLGCVLLASTPFEDWLDLNTYAGVAAMGAIIGATLFLAIQLLLYELTFRLWHWSCRMLRDKEPTLREQLLATVLSTTGMAVACAIAFVAFLAAAPYDLVLWVFPVLACMLPLVETFVWPWVQYARAPTLSSERLTDLEAWIEKLGLERTLPRIRFRIQNGPFPNAFAIGGIGAHLVVIGKGLVDGLSPRQLQAVVAHEIAHVANRDVPRVHFPVLVAASALYMVCLAKVSVPLFATESAWAVATGALLAGLLAALFIVIIPGFVSRRLEFRADRLAVELLGDGEPLVQALEQLCVLSGQRPDGWSWTHPTTEARVKAIRSLAT